MTTTSLATSARCFADELLEQIRDKFCHVDRDPILGERIYFENAGGALTLKAVVEASARIDALPDNAGRANATSQHLGELIADGRRAVATFLNAKDGVIATREGATSMIFALLDAATVNSRSGNVICTNIDHPATYDGADYFCQLRNLERRVAGVDPATGVVAQKAVLDLVDENTVAVAMVHASNVTGGLNDIHGLAASVRAIAPAAQVIIDGTQYVQHGGVDVDELDVDGYVFAAYKAFSKVGAGFAYVSPRLATAPHPKLAGKPDVEWDLGTRDAGNYACFREVVSYLEWLGAEVDDRCAGADDHAVGLASTEVVPPGQTGERARLAAAIAGIVEHETALSERLVAGLAAMPRVRVLGDPTVSASRQAVFAVAVDGVNPGDIVRGLASRGVVVHDRVRDAFSAHVLEALAAESAIRVSLAHYNSLGEVDRFVEMLDESLHA